MKTKIGCLVPCVIASFVLYASGVWFLGQHRSSQYNGEQFIIASALSHALLDTPIGSVTWGIVKQFVYQPVGTIQTTIDHITSSNLAQADLGVFWSTLPDGLGIVMVAIVSILFKLFGVTLAIFPAMAIGISALSAAALAVRFRDSRVLVVVFHFCLLTALLLAPTSTAPAAANEFPIGGLRYFGLLAMLPAFHILFEIFDRRLSRLSTIEVATTTLQVFLFVLCLNVRGASAYMLFAIATLVGAAVITRVATFDRRVIIAKSSAVLAALALSGIVVYALSPADYRREGRVTGVFWHRILISLGTNPSWPFGNLREQYNLCALPYTIPMKAGVSDANGGCIWTQHVLENKMTPGELVRGIGSASYEKVVRNGFFKIVAEYPAETAKTFLYHKFKLAFAELKQFLIGFKIGISDPKYRSLLFLILAQVLVVLFAWSKTAIFCRYTAIATASFFVWSIFPLIAAWATLHTIVDLGYWCFAAIAFGALALIELAKARPHSNFIEPRGHS